MPAHPQSAEQLAQLFHETYVRLAPEFGLFYRTREASAKPWADVPAQNKGLMIAVCAEIAKYVIEPELSRLQAECDGLRAELRDLRDKVNNWAEATLAALPDATKGEAR